MPPVMASDDGRAFCASPAMEDVPPGADPPDPECELRDCHRTRRFGAFASRFREKAGCARARCCRAAILQRTCCGQ